MLHIDLHKAYTSKSRAVNIACKVDFSIGKTGAIYGKSGLGKTTILRILAGLENADEGKISWGDEVWFDSENRINLPTNQRNIGLVFQDNNLFANMTVERNMTYASPSNQLTEATEKLIEITGIRPLLKNYPHELSRGQAQRVAIIRSFCQNPKLLLLDEPFSALDDDNIEELMVALSDLRKDVLLAMADEILILHENKVSEFGSPKELLIKKF